MSDLPAQRLYNHQLEPARLKTPAEVVSWYGAMQSQDYAGAKWALGLRLPGVTDADMDRAFQAGEILRTHVMRPTWHFVTPADMRWLLALTAPRVHALNDYYYRKVELDAPLRRQINDLLVKALAGGQQLTRNELAHRLHEAGIAAEGLRLGYIMMQAELDMIICNGSRRGKQFTYALFDERVPPGQPFDREAALAELTRRYFTSHGPALIKDFVWWSGLTTADAKAGLALLHGEMIKEKMDGLEYWRTAATPALQDISQTAHLIPPYDEYGVAYKDHSAIYDGQYQTLVREILGGAILIGGKILGTWQRTLEKNSVQIKRQLFRPLDEGEQQALDQAVQRYSDFLQLPPVLVA